MLDKNIPQINLRILYLYLFKVVIPPFLTSLLLFTFFIETLDILVNLIRYLDRNVPVESILQIQLFYLPSSLTYALPVAILFSVTFSIGQLYANNELIAIFVAGVSLLRFIMPLLVLGIVLSIGNFYFQEHVVINSFRSKNELTRVYLNQEISQSNSQVAILQEGGNIIYYADFYDNISKVLFDTIIVMTDVDNQLEMRINASQSTWTGNLWLFEDVNIYTFDPKTEKYHLEYFQEYSNPRINTSPENFKRIIGNIDEMSYSDALEYIRQLKASGHAYQKLLTDTYARIPLSFSPFIVMLLACFAGSIFKKNTMLMSLLNALISAVVYYSADLIGSILATRHLIPPLMGAWAGFIITIVISIGVYKYLVR